MLNFLLYSNALTVEIRLPEGKLKQIELHSQSRKDRLDRSRADSGAASCEIKGIYEMLIINNCVCIKKGYTRAEFKRSPLYDNQDMSMFFWLDDVVEIAGLDGKFGIGFVFGRKVLKRVFLQYQGKDGIFEDDIEKTYQQQIPIIEILKKSNPDAASIINEKELRSYQALIIIDY